MCKFEKPETSPTQLIVPLVASGGATNPFDAAKKCACVLRGRAKHALLTCRATQGRRGAGCEGQGGRCKRRRCSFVTVHHGAVAVPQVWLRVIAPVRRQAARRVRRG